MEENVPMNDDAVVEAVVFNEPMDNNMAAADSEAKEINVAAAPELPANPFDQFTKFAQGLQQDYDRKVEENARLAAQVDENERRMKSLVEDNDFLRQQYKQSSEAAFVLSKENQDLLSKIGLLENQLSVGLEARERFQNTTVNDLAKRLKLLQQERQLEMENENRAALSNVKERAGMYTELRSQYEDLRKEYIDHLAKQKEYETTIETLQLRNVDLAERIST
ncbi:hypothetical protein E3P99_03213 [Wallemia hederae]|uniref:Uncharacterized protein n=1 Tax=Wallemia hederae TaxID=1540922 RepID=A0A4T0FH40_9BASI|nr:hypothetical protein E3P99_03213 [Wallemia hederae]